MPSPVVLDDGEPDVELFDAAARSFSHVDRGSSLAPPKKSAARIVDLPDGSVYIHWRELFEFIIDANGRRILSHPLEEASVEAFQTYLLSQVLSFALLKQGFEPIHATVVVTGESAIGFLGDSGLGKSSLAASFLQDGYRLLTDDLLIVKNIREGYWAYPGPQRIKLFPEVAERYLPHSPAGTPMNNSVKKLVIPLQSEQLSTTPAPLRALYCLEEPAGEETTIEIKALSRRESFVALTRNTFNAAVTDAARLKRQFLAAAEVSSIVPLRSISFPRLLEFLPRVREAILRDISNDIGN